MTDTTPGCGSNSEARKRQVELEDERDYIYRSRRAYDRAEAAEAEVERLARWKAEALPVLDGLQELGKVLDLPLGAHITGHDAVKAVETLRADRDKAQAERDDLRTRLAAVEALADAYDAWDGDPESEFSSSPQQRDQLRAALSDTNHAALQEVQARAWDEGAITALDFATRNEDGIGLSLDLDAHPNPYRDGGRR